MNQIGTTCIGIRGFLIERDFVERDLIERYFHASVLLQVKR